MAGSQASTELLKTTLLHQLDASWRLATYHFRGLTDAECLWRPGPWGLHVNQEPSGLWRPDWPDHERYDIGPPSIAWLTWHIIYWWSMALDHTFGGGELKRENIVWPGDALSAFVFISHLQEQWRGHLQSLSSEALHSVHLSRFPFEDERAFADGVAWVNMELTKNASEIGYARFLYAVNVKKLGSGAPRDTD